MALDGAFLSLLQKEIEAVCLGARIDKIHQPSREELVLLLRLKGGAVKLLLSAGANSPRVHLTQMAPENPKNPPMFCMLARKHLGGGKLVAVRQAGLDRVLYLDFACTNELGDSVTITVCVEIMGRHSNIILIDQNGKILDAIKRVSGEVSRVRPVLPGMRYSPPPPQQKLDLRVEDTESIVQTITLPTARDRLVSEALLQVLEGFSPLVCRELSSYVGRGEDLIIGELTDDQRDRLRFILNQTRQILLTGQCLPTAVLDQDAKPKDYSFVDLKQYGSLLQTKRFETLSALLDYFYAQRDQVTRMKQRAHDLLKLLVNLTDRISRKLESQRVELQTCADRDRLKMMGDLINANLYVLEKGNTQLVTQNYYDPDGGEMIIPLDPMLTPAQNAQRYYAFYRKAATAEKMLTELIAKSQQELVYLDSVFDAVSRTVSEAELLEIRQELYQQGYLKRSGTKGAKGIKALDPIAYRSSDGFVILCGRNNIQNDKLTTKIAKKQDMWFHVKDMAGSHVIVVTGGREIPDRTYEEAFHIAAYNSKARGSTLVGVDYTQVKNLKKPNGAKPGMVIFHENYTGYVTPDEGLVQSLLQQ